MGESEGESTAGERALENGKFAPVWTWDQFVEFERTTKDTIDFKLVYVALADGNHLAAIFLSQLIYWELPDKRGNTRKRVEHDGKLWVVNTSREWYEQTMIKKKPLQRIIDFWLKKGIIECQNHHFNGSICRYVRIVKQLLTTHIVKANMALNYISEVPYGTPVESLSGLPSITETTRTERGKAPLVSLREEGDSDEKSFDEVEKASVDSLINKFYSDVLKIQYRPSFLNKKQSQSFQTLSDAGVTVDQIPSLCDIADAEWTGKGKDINYIGEHVARLVSELSVAKEALHKIVCYKCTECNTISNDYRKPSCSCRAPLIALVKER